MNGKIQGSGAGTDVGYWESLLQQLKAFMARVSRWVGQWAGRWMIIGLYLVTIVIGSVEGQAPRSVEKKAIFVEAAAAVPRWRQRGTPVSSWNRGRGGH